MPSEVSALDKDVDLKEIGLSQQLWDQLHPIGRQKETSTLETIGFRVGKFLIKIKRME